MGRSRVAVAESRRFGSMAAAEALPIGAEAPSLLCACNTLSMPLQLPLVPPPLVLPLLLPSAAAWLRMSDCLGSFPAGGGPGVDCCLPAAEIAQLAMLGRPSPLAAAPLPSEHSAAAAAPPPLPSPLPGRGRDASSCLEWRWCECAGERWGSGCAASGTLPGCCRCGGGTAPGLTICCIRRAALPAAARPAAPRNGGNECSLSLLLLLSTEDKAIKSTSERVGVHR